MTVTEPAPAAAPCSGPDALPDDGRRFDKVTIRGFRGLEDLELDGLGAFNLFVGANDVGKTSVLEAIFLLCGLGNPLLLVPIQNRRNYGVGKFDDLSNLFYRLNVEDAIGLTATTGLSRQLRSLSFSASDAWASEQASAAGAGSIRPDGKKGGELSSSFGAGADPVLRCDAVLHGDSRGSDLSVASWLSFHDGEPAGRIERRPALSPSEDREVMGRMSKNAGFVGGSSSPVKHIAEIITRKRKPDILECLRSIDPQIEDVAVSGNAAYLDIGLDRMLPVNMFGEGVGRTAAIVAQCILDEVDTILIDEIENGLHYKGFRPLFAAILRLAASRGAQVFATTHSIDALKALREILHEEEFKRFQPESVCYMLARDYKDKVRSYRLDFDQFDHSIEHDIEIRR